jgi:hypothetical protein
MCLFDVEMKRDDDIPLGDREKLSAEGSVVAVRMVTSAFSRLQEERVGPQRSI